ncbi:MAG: GH32 C-terminal domain-containing protein, partial [Pseudomonadota bacterium]
WMGEWKDGLFHPFNNEPKMLDILPGHLAPTVARAADGQLRAIGIVDERRTPQAQEDAGWAHTYSLPRTWRLMPDQRTLGQAPAPELRKLRGECLATSGARNLSEEPITLATMPHAYELEVQLGDTTESAVVAFDLLCSPDREECTRVSFDLGLDEVVLDLSQSTTSGEREGPDVVRGTYDRTAFGDPQTVRVFVDGSVIDVFVNDSAAFAFRSYPERSDSTGVQVTALKGNISTSRVAAWALSLPE